MSIEAGKAIADVCHLIAFVVAVAALFGMVRNCQLVNLAGYQSCIEEAAPHECDKDF